MISVVIRTLNEAKSLERLLKILKFQSIEHEVIVVDSGSTDFSNHSLLVNASSTSYNATATAGNNQIILGFFVGNVSGEGFGGLYYIHNPGDGSVFPLITGTSAYKTNGGVTEGGAMCATRDAVITLDRVQFIMSSGNITSGRVTAWGIKHA